MLHGGTNGWVRVLINFPAPGVLGMDYLPWVRKFGDFCLPVFWSSFVLSHSRDILCSAAVITLANHPLFTGAITCNPTPCCVCKLISPTALAPESLCFAALSPLWQSQQTSFIIFQFVLWALRPQTCWPSPSGIPLRQLRQGAFCWTFPCLPLLE